MSINKAMILGNVGHSPEVKTTHSGSTVATFSVATQRKKEDGTVIVMWHQCVAFGKIAETVSRYVDKGIKVFIEGEIEYQKYTDKHGIDRVSTKIIVFNLQLLSYKDNAGNEEWQSAQAKKDPEAYKKAKGNYPPSDLQSTTKKPREQDYYDDEIPF